MLPIKPSIYTIRIRKCSGLLRAVHQNLDIRFLLDTITPIVTLFRDIIFCQLHSPRNASHWERAVNPEKNASLLPYSLFPINRFQTISRPIMKVTVESKEAK